MIIIESNLINSRVVNSYTTYLKHDDHHPRTLDCVHLLTCFIQNKANLIFNSKLYQVPMITERRVTQNRVNSDSPE